MKRETKWILNRNNMMRNGINENGRKTDEKEKKERNEVKKNTWLNVHCAAIHTHSTTHQKLEWLDGFICENQISMRVQ